MPDYEKMYHLLFNAITDALDAYDYGEMQRVLNLLEAAQREAEELYLSAE